MKPYKRIWVTAVLLLLTAAPFRAAEPSSDWRRTVAKLRWVAYSPSSEAPDKREEPTEEGIRRDLDALRTAGFTGLVTYSSAGLLGSRLPALATSAGFRGLTVGIWDPRNELEIASALETTRNSIVLGVCVGNEGLHFRRYSKDVLAAAMRRMQSSGKPVTTSETVGEYSDPEVRGLGDWIFPTVHPYFAKRLEPHAAGEWTVERFKALQSQTKRFVWFKEVGLPSAGEGSETSEERQREYYCGLQATEVRFVYFEAFDQLGKQDLPVGPHWGLFTAQRKPKYAALALGGQLPCAQTASLPHKALAMRKPAPLPNRTVHPPEAMPFYIYRDNGSPLNRFQPTGLTGDIDDIRMDPASEDRPQSGKSCIRVEYTARQKGRHKCDYEGPCGWAGVYWQEPGNNWGTREAWNDKGFNLSSAARLTFWARSDRPARIDFKVGGIRGRFGDSLEFARMVTARLTTEWQPFEIDLRGARLDYIIGGFSWFAEAKFNPQGAVFYIDEIRFEELEPAQLQAK